MSDHAGVIAFLEHHLRVALSQAGNRLADPRDAAAAYQWSRHLGRAITELKAAPR